MRLSIFWIADGPECLGVKSSNEEKALAVKFVVGLAFT